MSSHRHSIGFFDAIAPSMHVAPVWTVFVTCDDGLRQKSRGGVLHGGEQGPS